MSDYEWGRANGLWGDDGVPYGINDYDDELFTKRTTCRSYSDSIRLVDTPIGKYVTRPQFLNKSNNYVIHHDLDGKYYFYNYTKQNGDIEFGNKDLVTECSGTWEHCDYEIIEIDEL